MYISKKKPHTIGAEMPLLSSVYLLIWSPMVTINMITLMHDNCNSIFCYKICHKILQTTTHIYIIFTQYKQRSLISIVLITLSIQKLKRAFLDER